MYNKTFFSFILILKDGRSVFLYRGVLDLIRVQSMVSIGLLLGVVDTETVVSTVGRERFAVGWEREGGKTS